MPSDYDPLERELAQLDEDAQRHPRRRTSRMLPIAVAAIALAVFGTIIWYAYSKGVREGSEVAAPLLTPDGPMKVAPDNPGGLQVPHQDKTIYNQIDQRANDRRVERILPPPEAPQPIPVFPPTAQPEAPGTAGANGPGEGKAPLSETAKGIPGGPTPLAPANGTNAAAAPKEPPLPAPELAKPPQPPTIANPPQPKAPERPESAKLEAAKKEEPKPAPAKPTTTALAGGSGFKVQIGSMRSEAAARKQWQIQSAKHKDLLGSMTLDVNRAEIPGKGTYYRVQAGTLPSAEAAKRICDELSKRKVGCIVVRP